MGNIIVRRVAEMSHVQVAHMGVGTSQFFSATANKEEKMFQL